MPRIARVVVVGLPHHITQKGNYDQNIFIDNIDREQYLFWVQEYSIKYGVSLLAYCLMDNHVHFIAIPEKEDSFARAFNLANMRYSQYFNKRLKTTGHLWQSRFYSCVLDEKHLIVAARYVERNPVRAKLIKKPWEWKWSSASTHIKKGTRQVRLRNLFDFIDMSNESWKRYIESSEDDKAIEELRKNTLSGRPSAIPDFLVKLEEKMERKLVALPRGRPKKRE